MQINPFLDPDTAAQLEYKRNRLFQILRTFDGVLVCFSGGVDSSYVCWCARKSLGRDKVLAVTALSPSLAANSRPEIDEWISFVDIRHQWIATKEFENPAYIANGSQRCYFCKTELYNAVAPLARAHGLIVIDGSNYSDLKESRPGYLAAQEHSIRHPLEEAELTKTEIVELARLAGLPNWNKPASPCLSSRIPHGQAVTIEALERVDRAETLLRGLGIRILRVRHLSGDTAKIETAPDELIAVAGQWQKIVTGFARLGFWRVYLDLYPKASHNTGLENKQEAW